MMVEIGNMGTNFTAIVDQYGFLGTVAPGAVAIHEGKLQFMYIVQTGTLERRVHFKTGDKIVHLAVGVSTGVGMDAYIQEEVTISVEGTSVPIRNYNRNYEDNNLDLTVYSDSTYTGGTRIVEVHVGSGTNPGTAQTGTLTAETEYILKPNTDYIFGFTPSADTTTTFGADIFEEFQ